MTAKDLVALLKERHKNDVFYTEVNIEGSGTPRLDAWALKPSYSNALTFGYEIKVSRSDFLNDYKMHQYEPYCNQLCLVTTKDVCSIDEIPENYGWLVVGGSRLITKKKAKTRDVKIPESFYQALLVNVNRYHNLSSRDKEIIRRIEKLQAFDDYLEGKKELQWLGDNLGIKLSREKEEIEYQKRIFESDKEEIERIKQFRVEFEKRFHISLRRLRRGDDIENVVDDISNKYEELTNPKIKIKKSLESTIRECERLIKDLNDERILL